MACNSSASPLFRAGTDPARIVTRANLVPWCEIAQTCRARVDRSTFVGRSFSRRKSHGEEGLRVTTKQVSEHLMHAARHHPEAAKHHEAGRYETAAPRGHIAMGHISHARRHAELAVKAHVKEADRPGPKRDRT